MFVKRKFKDVVIDINSHINVSARVFPFVFTCPDEAYAELLKDHIHEMLRSKIQGIAMDNYEQGYMDGKNKKKRKEYAVGMFYTFNE